jgi:hypothetical protein
MPLLLSHRSAHAALAAFLAGVTTYPAHATPDEQVAVVDFGFRVMELGRMFSGEMALRTGGDVRWWPLANAGVGLRFVAGLDGTILFGTRRTFQSLLGEIAFRPGWPASHARLAVLAGPSWRHTEEVRLFQDNIEKDETRIPFGAAAGWAFIFLGRMELVPEIRYEYFDTEHQVVVLGFLFGGVFPQS